VRGSIRGVTATLRWAYYDAARLEGYTITRENGDWRASGRVVWMNAYNLKQQPLYFLAPHQHGVWEWPVLECDIVEGRLRAKLGAPDERVA